MKFRRRNGYKTFIDSDGREKYVHRRVAEKKLSGPIGRGKVVHHINENKDDNKPENLAVVSRAVHGRLHAGKPNACFKCGSTTHWAAQCYARRDFTGRLLHQRRSGEGR